MIWTTIPFYDLLRFRIPSTKADRPSVGHMAHDMGWGVGGGGSVAGVKVAGVKGH